MQNMHFTPPQLARLIGVNESTIKRWVDRGMLPAEKTSGGHRRIYKDDIAAFVSKNKRLRKHSYILKRLSSQNVENTHQEYYSLLLSRDYAGARKVINNAYIAGLSVIEILESIIVKTLVHIGEEWISGELSIVDEHRMTLVMREHLYDLDRFVKEQVCTGKTKAILACVPKDNHELSLQIFSVALHSVGVCTEVLGINISAKELERSTKCFKPDLIALSKVYNDMECDKEYLKQVARTAKQSGANLAIGGGGWREAERKKLRTCLDNLLEPSNLSEAVEMIKKLEKGV